MNRIVLAFILLLALPALADDTQGVFYNSTTGTVQILSRAAGFKSIPVAGGPSPSILLPLAANYTITDTDGAGLLLVTTGSSTITVTLPSAATNKGRSLTFKKADNATGKITISRAGSDTIDGNTSTDIGVGGFNQSNSQYAFITLISTGSGWNVTAVAEVLTKGPGVGTNIGSAGSYTTITSIPLPFGVWKVSGAVNFIYVNSTTLSANAFGAFGISLTTNTIDNTGQGGFMATYGMQSLTQTINGAGMYFQTGERIITSTSSVPLTGFLVGRVDASVPGTSSYTTDCIITAVRIR